MLSPPLNHVELWGKKRPRSLREKGSSISMPWMALEIRASALINGSTSNNFPILLKIIIKKKKKKKS